MEEPSELERRPHQHILVAELKRLDLFGMSLAEKILAYVSAQLADDGLVRDCEAGESQRDQSPE